MGFVYLVLAHFYSVEHNLGYRTLSTNEFLESAVTFGLAAVLGTAYSKLRAVSRKKFALNCRRIKVIIIRLGMKVSERTSCSIDGNKAVTCAKWFCVWNQCKNRSPNYKIKLGMCVKTQSNLCVNN